MQRRMCLVQVAQCSVLLKNMRMYTVVSAHLPKALSTQRLDNLRVSHQSQVTCRSLSYEAVLFSSTTITGETLHRAKRFAVVWEEGPDEGLFDKEHAPHPPEIQNSTAPPSAPGDPIESGVFNASNRAEDISLVRNQALGVDYET